MSARTRVAEWFWPRDGRTAADVEAEVREELESHIERTAEELVRAGVQRDEARRQAAEKFGDVERYAAECRRIALGDRLIVRRALVIACLALVAATGYLGHRAWQSERQARELRRQLATVQAEQAADEKPAVEPVADNAHVEAVDNVSAWVERIAGLRDHMHTAFAVGAELTLLDPELGVQIVEEAWPRIELFEVKTGLLKAFAFSKALRPNKHPRLFAVLHLGMRDADGAVREYAASYLQEYAGTMLNNDAQAYDAWYQQYGHRTPAEILQAAQASEPRS